MRRGYHRQEHEEEGLLLAAEAGEEEGLPQAGAGDEEEELPQAGAVEMEELPMLEPGCVQLVGSSL